jgi:hypothetical protein
MRAKRVNEDIEKVHYTKLPNPWGYYPADSGYGKMKFNPIESATAVLALLKIPYTGKALRILTDGINNYLQRTEGYHYGISKGFAEAQSKRGVTVEHGIPLKVQIEMMINKINSGEIKTPENILQFLRDHYTVCLITKDENARLNAAKMGHRMPENWKDWTERYKIANIDLVQLPGNK